MSDLIAHTISHYHVVRLLGEGGMGAVYLAHDERLDRDLAIKVLPTTTMADETARARLLREARMASSLNHPNIAHVYEVGEDGGRDFIAMELVEGRTLGALTPSGGFPTEVFFQYGLQIAEALAYAHEHGVIHRDLKSANIMITTEGRVKVLDFGLAKRIPENGNEHTPQDLGLTRPGFVMGTPTQLPPEVLGGTTADARSDVWSFGVVLYEMASGKFPFRGTSMSELLDAIRRDPPTPLSARIPIGIQALILRCLAKEPGQRYQSASEIRAAIEALQQAITGPQGHRHNGIQAGTVVRVVGWSLVAIVAVGAAVLAWPRPKPKVAEAPASLDPTAATPATAPLDARASLVRITTEGEQPLAHDDVVRPGDHLVLDYQCKDSSYVYVCDEDDRGHFYALFPQAGVSTTNPLPAGSGIRLPGMGGLRQMSWPVTSAAGGERILVIASRTRLADLESELAQYAAGTRRVTRSPVRTRSIEGLEAAPEPRPPSPVRLRAMFSSLARRAQGQPDLWTWQQPLRSLEAATKQ